MLNVGDLINLKSPDGDSVLSLIVEVWTFDEYCKKADDNLLEIDHESAWKYWKENGPMIVVLNPGTQKPEMIWAREWI